MLNYKLIILASSLLLLSRCSLNNNAVSTNKINYTFDTIKKIYTSDFTAKYTGGIDITYLNSTIYTSYNFCGNNSIKIINENSDSIFILSLDNSSCDKIYTNVKENNIYVVTLENSIFRYSKEKRKKELVVDLNSIEKFKNSGLTVEWYKPGSDQYVNIPPNNIYFRLHQNFEEEDGNYSKMDYGYPIFAKYFIDSQKIDFFGEQPKHDEFNLFGLHSSTFDLYIGDSILTSNAINGNIQIINTQDSTIQNISIKSVYDIVSIKSWEYSKSMKDAKNNKMKHALLSPFYEPVYFNPLNNRYYRIFHPLMKEFNDSGLLNTDQDKICILMTFDSNFNLLDETILPIKKTQVLKLFPTQNGIYIYLPSLFMFSKEQAEFTFLLIEEKF